MPLWFEAQDRPPWVLALYARLPIPGVAVGAALAVAYVLGVMAWFTAMGVPTDMGQGVGGRFWEVPGWWTLFVNAAMLGFAPTVMAASLRSVEADVRELSPALASTDAETYARRVVRLPASHLRLLGLGAVGMMVIFTYWDPGLWRGRGRPPVTDPFFLWFLAQQVLLGWFWTRAAVTDVSTSRAFACLADEVQRVDLLDPRPLAAFARRGVRSVLYWMVGLALFSSFWLGPNAGRSNIIPFVLLVALAGSNLWILVGAARRCIRRAKEAELVRLRAAIRADQQALLQGGAGDPAARLPALFAAESRVASVGELPFDASTLLRFALYVTLGVGSWIGGALIERLLGAALD